MQNRRNYTPEVPEFKEKLVSVNRVAKVVKGGKIFRFSALIVVGDEKGRVGVGMGKAAEIPEAVRKGVEDAKRHLINVPIVGTTIPHAVLQGSCSHAPRRTRYRRYRGRSRSLRSRNGRHQRYPHQELRFQQPRKLREGNP